MVGFSSASLLTARKREAVIQGGTRVVDQLTRRRTQGAGNVKRWEDMGDHGCIQDTFTQNKNDTNAEPLDPQQTSQDSPHPRAQNK